MALCSAHIRIKSLALASLVRVYFAFSTLTHKYQFGSSVYQDRFNLTSAALFVANSPQRCFHRCRCGRSAGWESLLNHLLADCIHIVCLSGRTGNTALLPTRGVWHLLLFVACNCFNFESSICPEPSRQNTKPLYRSWCLRSSSFKNLDDFNECN